MLGLFWTLVKKPYWFQSLIKREVEWPSQVDVADLNRNIPTFQEDGAHFDNSPFYVEWWYFDSTFDDGSSISIIIHLTDLIKPASKNGSMNIAFMDKDKSVSHIFVPYPSKEITVSSDFCDIRIGRSHVWCEDNIYKLCIEESDAKAQLEFETTCESWRPGNGRFDFGNNKAFFSWLVPQPRAKVEGTMTIKGKTVNVLGLGYHDHNWGTVCIVDAIKDWSWGRIYLNDNTVIFADIHLSSRYGGKRAMRFAVFQGDRLLISSFLTTNEPLDLENDFLRNPKHSCPPRGWHIAGSDAYGKIDLVCESDTILEKADLLTGGMLRRYLIEKVIAHPYYLRCKVAVMGELTQHDNVTTLEGTGIYEQIILR
jgi:hypothetical protein